MAAIAWQPGEAQAAPDTFGIGNGHSGNLTVPPNTTAARPHIINAYAAVTTDVAKGATSIKIGHVIGAGAFTAGDLVLIWRATGVDPAAAPSGSQARQNLATARATVTGGTAGGGLVGQFELARVKSVAGSGGARTLTLEGGTSNAYTKLVSQVVRVPEYNNVTINAGQFVGAAPWQEILPNGDAADPRDPNPNNQWAGGIVTFMARGTITNNGTIHANGRGFHGGVPYARTFGLLEALICDRQTMDGNPRQQNAAFTPKGQGVVQSRYLATAGGRGNISSAGGGANCLSAGGGGGANQGNGGNGGNSALGLGTGGLGGGGLDFDLLNRMTMGGGGGAGRHELGVLQQNSLGGFGGGAVFIRGNVMVGSGVLQAVGANGENTGVLNLPPGVASEGSGGGGAGGSIVVRLTGTLDCSQLGSPGGNGGDAQVINIPIFGGGGGGGGGRVLWQAASKTDRCVIDVNPGDPGNNGGGGSTPGGNGGSTNPPGGGFCVDPTPSTPGSCKDPTPVCDNNTGTCVKCSGPFGSSSPNACEVFNEPVCRTTGECVPCKGDFGTPNADTCQLTANPYCFTTVRDAGAGSVGSCGKCTTNADCTDGPGHGGDICNIVAGNCGTACTKDEDCKNTEWCAPQAAGGGNVCTPKTPNGQPVPGIPPINGECTVEKGQRVCLSAKCEETDDLCGLKNGSPCGGATECRSNICFDRDDLCGKPNGEPCTGNGECRSDKCENGVCAGCDDDSDCKVGQVCDKPNNTCVDGCRPGADAGTQGACPPGQQCIAIDGGDIGKCEPIPDAGPGNDGGGVADAGDDFGLIEGGGCSCNSTLSSAASPFAILGAACGVLLLARRRRNSRSTRSQ